MTPDDTGEEVMLTPTESLLSLCAADIMSKQIMMIPREMSLQGAARLLARADVTGAPVVDANGTCIGVLSATDFMHWVENERKPGGKNRGSDDCMCSAWQLVENSAHSYSSVEEFMTKDPVLVNPERRIGELARMMLDAHIHRLIVVDRTSRRPIGIVSSMDILAILARLDQMQSTVAKAELAAVPAGMALSQQTDGI